MGILEWCSAGTAAEGLPQVPGRGGGGGGGGGAHHGLSSSPGGSTKGLSDDGLHKSSLSLKGSDSLNDGQQAEEGDWAFYGVDAPRRPLLRRSEGAVGAWIVLSLLVALGTNMAVGGREHCLISWCAMPVCRGGTQ